MPRGGDYTGAQHVAGRQEGVGSQRRRGILHQITNGGGDKDDGFPAAESQENEGTEKRQRSPQCQAAPKQGCSGFRIRAERVQVAIDRLSRPSDRIIQSPSGVRLQVEGGFSCSNRHVMDRSPSDKVCIRPQPNIDGAPFFVADIFEG